MKLSIFIFFSSLFLISACAQKPVDEVQFNDGSVQKVVRGKTITWNNCPPNLPKGCKVFVLDGHPKKDKMFTVRFKVDNTFYMPPHTHPKDERVTILSGKFAVGFGKDATKETATKFGPGDYYINKRGEVHKVWGVEPGVLQITGVGPWKADFLN